MHRCGLCVVCVVIQVYIVNKAALASTERGACMRQVLEDWRYIAMVIDRLQLYIFLAVTVAGTVSILINAPHIYTYVDQDSVIAGLRDSTNINGTLPR